MSAPTAVLIATRSRRMYSSHKLLVVLRPPSSLLIEAHHGGRIQTQSLQRLAYVLEMLEYRAVVAESQADTSVPSTVRSLSDLARQSVQFGSHLVEMMHSSPIAEGLGQHLEAFIPCTLEFADDHYPVAESIKPSPLTLSLRRASSPSFEATVATRRRVKEDCCVGITTRHRITGGDA
jgi:hypothetical protein